MHTHTLNSYPGPELLIQSTGDQTALKEDANPVVVVGNRSLLWYFLRLGCDLWPLCGFLARIYPETMVPKMMLKTQMYKTTQTKGTVSPSCSHLGWGLWYPCSAERSPSPGRSAKHAAGHDRAAWRGSTDVWSTGQRKRDQMCFWGSKWWKCVTSKTKQKNTTGYLQD